MRQVLVNLAGNAVRLTPHDDWIAVTTAERECDGMRWGEVRVTDTGPGIAQAERTATFEPYYGSEAAVREPGVGLGLTISHGLVQQMGGVIEIESEVGAGTIFIVRLPLATWTSSGVPGRQ